MSASRGDRRRRTAVISSLVLGAFLLPAAVAHAEPTASDVQEEIERLEEEFIELNATYNEAKESYEAAEEKLEGILGDIETAENKVEALSGGVRALANTTYTGVDLTSPAQLIGATGPEAALEHQADLTYLSEQHQENLAQYVEELEHLEGLRTEAEATEQAAADALEEAEEATEAAEEAIGEQEELLSELTAEEQAAATENISTEESASSGGGGGGSGGGGGASYTGPASGNAQTVLDFAYAQIGKPYIWGGTGPNGYDCSGLTQAAWAQVGVTLPRVTYDQINAGQRVSWENKQPGDLLFFYGPNPSHVGLYAGNGVMVHASTSARPIGTVQLSDYYRSNFVAAVRP
ncbi:C40 family peptidase [Nocardiopsis metallicus]|uniref:Cell wall-associated NlpC family hydrolase n=1 Tax=Nocardiopsis metallicus TaxID=179819 RepID=A0A840WIN0_9ACTN|nr:C40 family peptidase [Nocardiopsis metallicus]MBB5491755.1 cell wall-associated NlpC family hydrolase [Nocardiopsis metallicus]